MSTYSDGERNGRRMWAGFAERSGGAAEWLVAAAIALGMVLVVAVAGTSALAQSPSNPAASPRKVVGLVFDDSGSMAGRIQLPAFAAQLLASSLDPTRDRLFTLRLSHYLKTTQGPGIAQMLAAGGGVTPDTMMRLRDLRLPDLPREEFAQSADPEGVVKGIREEWSKEPHSNTPYGAVELMLQTLVAEAGPADEAHLVILTDGGFSSSFLPLPATVEEHLKIYNSRKRSRALTSHFVLIDPQGLVEQNSPLTVAQNVERQGVRSALTFIFNGRPDERTHEVARSQDLMKAMFDVIARINSTDRTAGPAAGGVVAVSGQRLDLRSPLSVSRIVGITFASTNAEAAVYRASDFGAKPTISIKSWMTAGDTAAGWRGETLTARTMQFNFRDALGPGSHWIDFDSPIGNPHLFLFDTLAQFDVTILDASGAPLAVGKDGVPEAVVGQPLLVVGTLRDHVGGRDTVVDPATVANGTATAWVAPEGDRIELPLSADAVNRRYAVPWTPARIGRVEAGGTFSVQGFVRKEANRPMFRVIDGALGPGLGLALKPLDCKPCRDGEFWTRVKPGEPGHQFAEIEARAPPERNPAFTLALEDAPPWIEIVDLDGRRIEPAQRLVAGPDGRLRARLKRHFERPDEPRSHDRHVGVRMRLLPPYTGEAATDATLHVEVPEVRLQYRGHTRLAAGDTPLQLSGADLHRGHEGLRFKLQGLAGQPVRAEDITVTAAAGLVRLPVTVEGDWITVRPMSGWCTCLVSLVGAPSEIEVLYRGVGEARASGPLEYRPTSSEFWWSCGTILLVALTLLWLFGAVLIFIRTPRFPSGSFALIKRRNQPVEASEPLNRWNSSGNWRTLAGALLWRQLPARVFVEGLHLEATKGAPRLLLASTAGEIKIVNDGRTVRKIREGGRAKDSVPLNWGATFSDQRSLERLSFRRS